MHRLPSAARAPQKKRRHTSRQFRVEDPPDSLPAPDAAAGEPTVERLRSEIRELRRENECLRDERDQRRRDPLTGVHDARFFYRRLREEIARTHRFGAPTSILVVEVLPLAELTYVSGPAAGHRILRWMVGMVTHHTREFDVVARLGGAELGLVLPSTDVSGTSALAERLLETLRREDERPPLPEGITLEVALGAATAPVHGETPVELVMAAEERLITGRGVDSVRFGVSAA